MDFQLIHIEETDSTNRWLRNYMASDKHGLARTSSVRESPSSSDAIIAVADYQTAGKGCGNNSWESERGKNLTFSLLIHPERIPANEQFRITEVASVALCETLAHYISNKVEIK